MAIIFTNPDTAKLFETDFENDPWVEVGCECNNGQGYKGPLSNLPPLAAVELISQKSNLVKAKEVPAKEKASKQSSS